MTGVSIDKYQDLYDCVKAVADGSLSSMELSNMAKQAMKPFLAQDAECCAACDKELIPVFDDSTGIGGSQQYKDALIVILDGGYGMFLDNLYIDTTPTWILCFDCAIEFANQNKWFKEFLERKDE